VAKLSDVGLAMQYLRLTNGCPHQMRLVHDFETEKKQSSRQSMRSIANMHKSLISTELQRLRTVYDQKTEI
jgi:hypothetical protein